MGTQKLRALDPLVHKDLLDLDLLHKENDFIERFYRSTAKLAKTITLDKSACYGNFCSSYEIRDRMLLSI